VGFSTPKKSRNPNSDFVCGMVDSFFVIVKKGGEMVPKLLSDDILFKFLHEALFIVNLDNTVDDTVNVLLEHRLDLHLYSSD